MKVFVIGDPHFKCSNIADMDILSDRILKRAEALEPDFIVIMGDVLDRHANLHMTPLNRAIDLFDRLKKISPLYVLIGNHDRKNNQDFLTDEHPFTAVEKWDSSITIVHKPISVLINNERFTFVPYVPPGRFFEALDYTPQWKDSRCIFAHQEFYGSANGNIISIEGDRWDSSYPLCISGHIHTYSFLQKNLIYVGTPYQNNFGEKGDKTVSLFHFDENDFHEDRIDLGMPKKLVHTINSESVKDYHLSFGDHHKVMIECTPTEWKVIQKHPNVLQWKKAGALVLPHHIFDRELKTCMESKQPTKKNFFQILKYKLESDNKLLTLLQEEIGTLDVSE